MFSQQDVFIELIVKRKKSNKDYLKIGGALALFVLLVYGALVLMAYVPYVMTFFPLILAAGIFGLYYVITNMDKEFEYICTNGILDIDVIIHKRKRKRLVSMAAKDMEILAPIDSDDYKQNMKNQSLKKMDLTTNTTDENVWFFVGAYKGSRVLVTFEPDERILNDLKRHNPSKVKYTLTKLK